jgi:serine phosphatase RsbU (regulator of sigma subunit)/pSer/pThr/pTyr-binding forkhead associated (FHA) protein
MPRELAIQLQDGTIQTLPLIEGRVTLGRSVENTLAYPDDPILSRRHMIIDPEGEDWFVEDLNSKNGTMVNGLKLAGRHRLELGDRIGVGRVTITFRDAPLQSDQTVVFVPEETTILPSNSVSTNLEKAVGPDADLEVALRTPAAAGIPRLQALLEAGREFPGHRPLGDLFKIILELAVNTVGARRGVVMTIENGKLVPQTARGDSFRISRAVRDKVINEKQSLLITDTSQNQAFAASETIVAQRVRSLMAVPLQTKDTVIGLIYVDSPDIIRPFTSEDLTVLTVMANNAAINIEHRRLVEVEQAERVMAKELEQAAEIQKGLLPKAVPEVPGLDVGGLSVACRHVGGDYYDFLELSDGRIGIIVGDVAGKGMSAALLMSNLQARVQILAEEGDDMATLMTRLNRSVTAACPGNRFITFFMCIIDPRTGEFEASNAGHNPPYIVRADGAVETLVVGGPVLGILRQMTYEAERGKLNPGDVLLLFSDGVTEARSPDDEEYGEERLVADLTARRTMSAQQIARGAFEAVENFMAGRPAGDDITVVAVKLA